MDSGDSVEEGIVTGHNVFRAYSHLQGFGLLIANFKDSSWNVDNASKPAYMKEFKGYKLTLFILEVYFWDMKCIKMWFYLFFIYLF